MPPKRIIHAIKKAVPRVVEAVRPNATEALPANEHLRELRRKFGSNMRRGVMSVHIEGYGGNTSMVAIHKTPDGTIGMDANGNVYQVSKRAEYLMSKRKLDKQLGR